MIEQTLDIEIAIRPSRGRLGGRDRKSAADSSDPVRIPRITRLMALAIKFQDMVHRGEVRDYADLARLGYVSRARITQVMNMLNLAPDLQEHILFGGGGPAEMRETQLRPVVRFALWDDQRQALAPQR
jgi:hypothetical protein